MVKGGNSFVEYQTLKKKLVKKMKKNVQKLHVIQKIAVPLQRFNKQLIVLHV